MYCLHSTFFYKPREGTAGNACWSDVALSLLQRTCTYNINIKYTDNFSEHIPELPLCLEQMFRKVRVDADADASSSFLLTCALHRAALIEESRIGGHISVLLTSPSPTKR